MVKLVTDTNLTASVNAAVAALVAGAPGALDTLNELATALGDDANFAATVTAALGNRLTWRGAWAPATNYVTNDVVTFNGGLYRAPNNFTSAGAFVLANWVELHAQTGTYASLKEMAAVPDMLLTGAITRDTNGAATAGTATWPDGATGVYAGTASTAFPGAVDSYTITHILSGVTTTYTQPTVTRDASTGAVTTRPAITVS